MIDESGGDPVRIEDAAELAGEARRESAAGASGTKTGRRVRSFTNSATCGFQNSAVAYQLPSAIVGSTGSSTGAFTRSSSFLVAWIVKPDVVAPVSLARSPSEPDPCVAFECAADGIPLWCDGDDFEAGSGLGALAPAAEH